LSRFFGIELEIVGAKDRSRLAGKRRGIRKGTSRKATFCSVTGTKHAGPVNTGPPIHVMCWTTGKGETAVRRTIAAIQKKGQKSLKGENQRTFPHPSGAEKKAGHSRNASHFRAKEQRKKKLAVWWKKQVDWRFYTKPVLGRAG